MTYSSLFILSLLYSDEVTQESIVALMAPLCLFEKGGTKYHFFSGICLSISTDPQDSSVAGIFFPAILMYLLALCAEATHPAPVVCLLVPQM